ncbi:MAG: 30S ribosomal protein S1, partial [Verrucomicrobiota bacterium]
MAEIKTTDTSDIDQFLDLTDVPGMESLLSEGETSSFAENAILTGRVAEKRDNVALIDIGYKAEGAVPRDEFSDWENLQVGDEIDVLLEEVEDENNMPVVSVRKAEMKKAWDRLVTECEEGSVVKGLVKHRVKGGFIVDLGIEAFLPGSQVDIGAARNLDDYVGNEFDFKILKINPDRRNVVVSRRELLEEERAEKRKELLKDLEPGQLRMGTVKNITEFGAFIDLDGLDGLLHITDMSWGRVNHPSEVVKVGEEIEVMVLDVDHERQRVSLGLKQKEGNPWDTVDVKYPEGTRIQGRVVNIMPYGAFVELEQGVEGLIHVSEMSWTKKISRASDLLSVGDEVEAVVLDVKKDARKISLGLRQTMENPWEMIAEEFPCGSKIRGKVRNMTSYGAFVQIRDDIDGMIHVSDMSWTRKINHPSEMLKKGEEVEAVILDIDPEQQRISLGMKQLTEDPWSNIESHVSVGDVVEATVTKITSFGAFVELEQGIEGLIHISQLSDERVEDVNEVVQVGQTVNARVVRIDSAEHRLGLSLASSDEAVTAETGASGAVQERTLRPGESIVDMGDAFSDAFAGLTAAAEKTKAESDESTSVAEDESATPSKQEIENPPADDTEADETNEPAADQKTTAETDSSE